MRFVTNMIVVGTFLAVIVLKNGVTGETIEFANLHANHDLANLTEINFGKAIQMFAGDGLTEMAHAFNVYEVIREVSTEAKKYNITNLNDIIRHNTTSDIFSELLQLWLSISSPCHGDTIKIVMEHISNIHNKPKQELPIWRMVDSWGKIPERVLFGNTMWLGAYEECTEIPVAKYCNTELQLKGSPLPIRYGSCIPKRCTSEDMNLVIHFLQKKVEKKFPGVITYTDTLCDDPEPPPYSVGAFATLILLAILGSCVIIGTAIEVLQNQIENEASSKIAVYSIEPEKVHSNGTSSKGTAPSKAELKRLEANGVQNDSFVKELEDPVKEETNIDMLEVDELTTYHEEVDLPADTEDTIKSSAVTPPNAVEVKSQVKREKKKNSTIADVFLCFSIIKNTNTILSAKVTKGNITSINGIRFFSLTWVLLGHYYDVVLASLPNNLLSVTNIVHRFTFLGVVSAYVSVDTFFVLSGLLFSYLTLKKMSKHGMRCGEVLMMYVHRYIRLTPPLAVAMLFWTNLFPTIVTGPMRTTIDKKMYVFWKPCQDNWWSTLLFINNFYPDSFDKECMKWTWYLANDTQFYILAPGILALMMIVQKASKGKSAAVIYNMLVLGSMCVISMIITGIITGVYDIPALSGDYILPNNPRANQVSMIMDRIYVKPYIRIPPYLIGMFLGYLFHKEIKPTKTVVVCGWIAALISGMIVVYGPWKVFKVNGTFFTNGENIMYAATHRVIWSCAVAWVIYACHHQYGGFVDKILSWKVFIPLSRLTYNTYLVHLMVMVYFVINRAVPSHYQDCFLVSNVISMTFISYAMAYVLCILVEFPVVNLEKIVFGK